MSTPDSPLPRRRPLLRQIGLVSAVGAATFLSTPYRAVASSDEESLSRQKETQLQVARSVASQVAFYMDGLQKQVAAIARTLEMGADTGLKSRVSRIRQEGALKRYFRDNTSFVYVAVVDSAGVAAVSGLYFGADIEVQERLTDAFKQVQQGNAMTCVPTFSKSLQAPVVVLADPVMAAGKVQGDQSQARHAYSGESTVITHAGERVQQSGCVNSFGRMCSRLTDYPGGVALAWPRTTTQVRRRL